MKVDGETLIMGKCVECGKRIEYEEPADNYLTLSLTVRAITADEYDDSTASLPCCSWKCVFERLKKEKHVLWADLPIVHYRAGVLPGCGIDDLLALLK